MMKPRFLAALLCVSTGVTAAPVLDLKSAYALALEHEPRLQAIAADRAAAEARVTIARGALLPQASVTASMNDITLKQPDSTGTTDYRSDLVNGRIAQPLFNLTAWQSFRAARADRDQSQAQADADTQSVLLSLATAYVEQLRGQDRVRFALARERAAERQVALAEGRFRQGVVARTDVLEATAQRDQARADRLTAEIDRDTARDQLEAVIGAPVTALAGLKADLPIVPPEPADLTPWMDRARRENPVIQAGLAAQRAAEARKRGAQGSFLPAINFFLSYSDRENFRVRNDRAVGGTIPAIAFNSGSTETIGIEAQWDLFRGGSRIGQLRENQALLDSVRARLRSTELTVDNTTRSLHRNLSLDPERLSARVQALRSAQLARDAAEAGYRVGTRDLIDVLQAETTLLETQLAEANARYDYLLNTLRLYAQTGDLNETLIDRVNSWLDATTPATTPAS